MKARHIPVFILVTLFTFILHEGAHWLAGELLGYDMWVNLNSAGLASGAYTAEWHNQFVSAAGPVVTVAQALTAAVLVRKHKSIIAFGFVFAALMMRVMAAVFSLGSPNDEARVSDWLGMGPWTLHMAVIGTLLWLTIRSGRDLKLGWRSYGLAYLAVSIAIAAIVLGDAKLPDVNPYR